MCHVSGCYWWRVLWRLRSLKMQISSQVSCICLWNCSCHKSPRTSILKPVFRVHSKLQSPSSISVPTGKLLSVKLTSWQYDNTPQYGMEKPETPTRTCVHVPHREAFGVSAQSYLKSLYIQSREESTVMLSWASLSAAQLRLYITCGLFIYLSYILRKWSKDIFGHDTIVSTRWYQMKRLPECWSATHTSSVPQWWDQRLLGQTGS